MSSEKNGNRSDKRQNNHHHDRNSMFYCGCCGLQRKKKQECLYCIFCKNDYESQAASALAKGRPVPTQLEWALNKARATLAKFANLLKAKTEELDQVREDSRAEATAFIEEHAGGVSDNIKNDAIRERTSDLYREKGGNRLFAQTKALEEGIRTLNEMIPQLEAKLKSEAAPEEAEEALPDGVGHATENCDIGVQDVDLAAV